MNCAVAIPLLSMNSVQISFFDTSVLLSKSNSLQIFCTPSTPMVLFSSGNNSAILFAVPSCYVISVSILFIHCLGFGQLNASSIARFLKVYSICSQSQELVTFLSPSKSRVSSRSSFASSTSQISLASASRNEMASLREQVSRTASFSEVSNSAFSS